MESIKKTVGENLKKVCKLKGIKNVDIANYMEVSPGSVSHWFKGDNFLDIDNLYKLCRYLNVSLDQVFGLDPIIVGVLNNDENEILVAYRNANDDEKNMIRRALKLPESEKDMSLKAE